MKKRKHCLHCKKKVYARGLCWPHYRFYQNRVYRGLVSWKTLMRQKKVLPKRA